MSNLNSAHAKSLYRVLSSAGIDCSNLKALNPCSTEFSQTLKGREIQMKVEGMSPQLAIELKREAGLIEGTPLLLVPEACCRDALYGSQQLSVPPALPRRCVWERTKGGDGLIWQLNRLCSWS